jgi:superfamily I DNA and/or RNA helicase
MVVEEAGEVLEAHVLASLAPDMEHLIQIGDHEQLRPKMETHELCVASGCGLNYDLSMFERLVRQLSFPVATLSEQRRMRPSISRLIAPIYPHLKVRKLATS